MEKEKLKGNYIITGKIKTLSGLHIGGSKETLNIGGVDSPVIRNSRDEIYVPGSSLKGKLRYLLEVSGLIENVILKGTGHEHAEGLKPENCPICNLFGSSAEDSVKPKIIVRDSYYCGTGANPKTEEKIENSIDRVSVSANPRHIERVEKDSIFDFEIVLLDFENGSIETKKLFEMLITSMRFLEDNYLGGSGTRGYGKISFEDIKVCYKGLDYYEGNGEEKNKIESENLELLKGKISNL